MTIDNKTPLTFVLDVGAANLILKALGKQPHEEVAAVVSAVLSQANQEITRIQNTPSAMPAPEASDD